MQQVTHVTGKFPFDAVDCVKGDATILSFIRPRNVLKTQKSTTTFILDMNFDSICRNAMKMYPSVLSGRVSLEFGTVKGLDRGIQQRRFFHYLGNIIHVCSLQLRSIYEKNKAKIIEDMRGMSFPEENMLSEP